MDLKDLYELSKIFGPTLTILIVVLYWNRTSDNKREQRDAAREVQRMERDAAREQQLTHRIAEVEDRSYKQAEALTAVASGMIKAVENNTKVMERAIHVADKRPCVAGALADPLVRER